jgi:hypothetical protein
MEDDGGSRHYCTRGWVVECMARNSTCQQPLLSNRCEENTFKRMLAQCSDTGKNVASGRCFASDLTRAYRVRSKTELQLRIP